MPSYLSPGVYVEEVSSGSKPIEGVGTAVAAFVGLTEQGPANTPTLVTNWTQFSQAFGDFVEGSYLAHAVYGYFLNGGGSAYVVRIGSDGDCRGAERERGARRQGRARPARLPRHGRRRRPRRRRHQRRDRRPGEPGEDTFKLTVSRGGKVEETFDNVTTKRGPTNVATVVKARSKLIRLEEIGSGGAMIVPEKANVTLSGGTAVTAVRVTADDYVGNTADRTGFAGLEAIDEVTMLCVPDLMAAYQRGIIDLEGVQAVQLAMIAHCELMGDRVAILDAPPALNAQQVKEWRVDKAGYDSKYAALYWPWIKVFDPLKGQGMHDAAERAHGRHLGAQRRHARRAQGARQRGRPRRDRARAADHQGRARPAQSRRASTASARSPAGASGCGARARSRAIRSGGTSTCAGSSTTSRSRSSRARSGSCSSPTTPRLWDAVKRNVTAFLRRVWRDGALFGAHARGGVLRQVRRREQPARTRSTSAS